MRGERHLLRLGEYLVCRACQRLPQDTREERLREWAAELPAILHDPQIRFAPRRAARMLAYAADTLRGAAMTPTTARRRADRLPAAFYLLSLAGGLLEVAQPLGPHRPSRTAPGRQLTAEAPAASREALAALLHPGVVAPAAPGTLQRVA